MIKIGIIGTSEGNGHPYSFSAIFNGYDPTFMQQSGWDNIYAYLQREKKESFGIDGAKVTHVYSQDEAESQKIAQASKITHICSSLSQMLESVDAVIIARDDWKSHYDLALPFLEADKFVFIDKPLSLDNSQCIYFRPFIQKGKLISFSSLNFSPELDEIRSNIHTFGPMKLIRGITPKSWEKYGIHLLDGIKSVINFQPKNITAYKNIIHHVLIETQEGFLIELDCMDNIHYPMLQLEFFSKENYFKANCLDAFNSFKRMLKYFVNTIKGQTDIKMNLRTLEQMQILQGGVIL